MIIGIDLGHECYPDTGAVGVVTEESIIDNVGSKVIEKLRNLGHTVILPLTATKKIYFQELLPATNNISEMVRGYLEQFTIYSKYEDLYSEFDFKGTPYYISIFDNEYFIIEIYQ